MLLIWSDGFLEAAMTDLGHPVGGQVFVDVHSRGLPNAAGEYTWGDAPDQNYVHEHGRTILYMVLDQAGMRKFLVVRSEDSATNSMFRKWATLGAMIAEGKAWT
ncbi:hypothetical protein DL546_001053 [Coniochaeta pulveracea]|uniref:Uncharacterized protein n=1 Tax=Coniochaeta pulveracea TaxID=177199 RepID=A0A420XZT3_9PEZI|nr:hypothetical protein DL546_001053 [Coniochaeta pulveracea]